MIWLIWQMKKTKGKNKMTKEEQKENDNAKEDYKERANARAKKEVIDVYVERMREENNIITEREK